MTESEELSEAERQRLANELKQAETHQAGALKEGFVIGGGLGNHEQRAELDERVSALRRQLGRESPEAPAGESGRGWMGWVILGGVCVGVVVAIWAMNTL
ncbi:hypothetical protein [Microbacterium sp. p3-SID336]|uniref:hypothetical protein n=1 Tax=Microbacterium sp. p3-SID336 TaxID=2916212 RepID=UPI0021A84194|nr:hypothetical protein [Microbacterium sp. p3-SID336]MCT1478117.1 hypothetical protein [Microbacterium sp. p3-SID336]